MNIKFINKIFLAITCTILAVLAFTFWSVNGTSLHSLPETKGSFSEWGVSSCRAGSHYVRVDGWSAPEGALKLHSQLYLSSDIKGKYYKLNTFNFRRGNESELMKEKGYLDNSGISAGIRFIFGKAPKNPKIVIISLGADGALYRGDYDCE